MDGGDLTSLFYPITSNEDIIRALCLVNSPLKCWPAVQKIIRGENNLQESLLITQALIQKELKDGVNNKTIDPTC